MEVPEGTPDALAQLFKFVEADIPSYRLQEYYSLKLRVLDEIAILKVDSRDTICERKIFKRKRNVKAEEKKTMSPPASLAPQDTYKYPRESIRESI